VKEAHEHAGSRYNVGWSHGKEALRSGLKDTHKGSFYANPLQVGGLQILQHTQLQLPPAVAPLAQQLLTGHCTCNRSRGAVEGGILLASHLFVLASLRAVAAAAAHARLLPALKEPSATVRLRLFPKFSVDLVTGTSSIHMHAICLWCAHTLRIHTHTGHL
jgi:hypothetical protein